MSKKKVKPPIDFENAKEILATLVKETPRATVILGCALLDDALEELLRGKMRPSKGAFKLDRLFEGTGPLATFAARIDIAYALALINPPTHKDLHVLRGIRNDFAHSRNHNLTLDTPAIRDRFNTLQGGWFLAVDDMRRATSTQKFTIVVMFLAAQIAGTKLHNIQMVFGSDGLAISQLSQ